MVNKIANITEFTNRVTIQYFTLYTLYIYTVLSSMCDYMIAVLAQSTTNQKQHGGKFQV